jgi:aryl-alcohol dehydrogenase-like predicted oxidoreductase
MIAEKLKAHAESRGVTLVHWATAWVLNNKTISSAIAGPRTFEQWGELLRRAGLQVDARG